MKTTSNLPTDELALFPRKRGRPRSKPKDAEDTDLDGASNGIRAMEVGLSVLRSIGEARHPLPLGEIATSSGLTPSRVHRYLASLISQGFVAQDGRTGEYWLGDAVVEIGLLALGHLDSIQVGMDSLQAYSDLSGLDGHLSVWGTYGPTVVRWQSGARGLQIRIEEGRVLPLLWSATGRLLCAFRSNSEVRTMLKGEIALWNREHNDQRITLPQVFSMLDAVRARALSSSMPTSHGSGDDLLDVVFPRPDAFGLETVAVPIFDHLGRAPMALTVFGTSQLSLHGSALDRVKEIVEVGRRASRRLGYGGPL